MRRASRKRRKQEEGFALIMALLIVAIVSSLVIGSLLLSSVNIRISGNDAVSTQALNVAQAGSAYWKAELVSLYRHMVENISLYENAVNDYIAASAADSTKPKLSCGNYFVIGLDLNRDGTIDVSPNGTLPDISVPVGSAMGVARVRFRVEGSSVVLDSRGTLGSGNARVIETFNLGRLDVWNSAVFAQQSAANATVSGRAEIRGAVHILGTGLGPTDKALDISGSFGLGNTYRGLNPSLGVDAAEMRLTFPDPEDLCATLRVKSGYVEMGGNSQIGYAESTNKPLTGPDTIIDNMRGIYTNHGITGGTEGTNVFSQNGMSAKYDAGNTFVFPLLDDKIKVMTPSGEQEIKRWEQLERNALKLSLTSATDDRATLPILTSSGALPASLPSSWSAGLGKAYLSAGCSAALFGVTNGTTATRFELNHSTTLDFSCIKYRMAGSVINTSTDEIITEVAWTKSSNELYVGGKGGGVMFDGTDGADLVITGGGGSNVEITYKGRGILFAEGKKDVNGLGLTGSLAKGGNITLEVDFLPASGNAAKQDARGKRVADATYANTYPATAVVGLVARNRTASTGAQKRFTVAIYSQEKVDIEKQTLIAGAIVTKSFDVGSQVPTVLYVPTLAERIPSIMPGAEGSGFAVSNVAWSRR